MDFRDRRYFVAVAEELHFRRAAERLRVAQAAATAQVRKLEDDLDVQLLDRTPRVALTPAGEALLVEPRRVRHESDEAWSAALAAHDHADGRLRVRHSRHVVPLALPPLLARFAAASPRVDVLLETRPSLELVERVSDRPLDAAICRKAPEGQPGPAQRTAPPRPN